MIMHAKKHVAARRYRGLWRGWLWIGPAVLLEVIFFIYPLLNTLVMSFQNADETNFVGLKNYQMIFTNAAMLEVLKNNLFWLLFGTVLTVGLGLLVAVLVDQLKVESLVKSALFVPMAISFVGAGIIWRLVYIYQPAGDTQIGLLNALLALLKLPPQAWLINPNFNNYAMLLVYVWMWTGFCMVILSAGLKNIPDDIVDAARIDGANRLRMFWHITVPLLRPTLAVVSTTMIINILKIFDIVYVMTGGNYRTDVVALEFYNQLFTFNNYGLASALAILLFFTIAPIMYINIRRLRAEESLR
ncbi:alpha-glucoside ABC transporter permease [Dictyobacter kobayashii]|uniref:Alpha-glucoside ABC transporter permease n=2 Tax=Dictyobacter kobayashii TaxID=2014872 RepID=A0A402AQG4_9CHLR|nr:alpha-glucoside ABC transporter permease [Dictyobacter kobayashii]